MHWSCARCCPCWAQRGQAESICVRMRSGFLNVVWLNVSIKYYPAKKKKKSLWSRLYSSYPYNIREKKHLVISVHSMWWSFTTFYSEDHEQGSAGLYVSGCEAYLFTSQQRLWWILPLKLYQIWLQRSRRTVDSCGETEIPGEDLNWLTINVTEGLRKKRNQSTSMGGKAGGNHESAS